MSLQNRAGEEECWCPGWKRQWEEGRETPKQPRRETPIQVCVKHPPGMFRSPVGVDVNMSLQLSAPTQLSSYFSVPVQRRPKMDSLPAPLQGPPRPLTRHCGFSGQGGRGPSNVLTPGASHSPAPQGFGCLDIFGGRSSVLAFTWLKGSNPVGWRPFQNCPA